MKKKERTTMHAMKPVELTKIIRENTEKLAEYRVNRYSKQSKNVREGAAYRRKIAVAETILKQKELSHE
jgi:ribosomal protein L29